VLPGLRARWDRIGSFRLGALFLIIFGILQVVLEIQSPSFIMFDGIKVSGSTINGATAYRYHGRSYHIVDKIDHSTRRHPTTVWLSRSDPSDPSKAYVDQTSVRWIDIVTTIGPFVAAGLLVLVGFVRDVRRRAEVAHRIGLPGAGIPDDFVAKHLRELRSPPPPES
jgi:hypothetical protein